MQKIETADEARAMFLANDADAIEEAATEWLSIEWNQELDRCGVDPDGNIWFTEDEQFSDDDLVRFANWARETLN